jgi:hypothetical protein
MVLETPGDELLLPRHRVAKVVAFWRSHAASSALDHPFIMFHGSKALKPLFSEKL